MLRSFLLSALICCSLGATAQASEPIYYDINWKPCTSLQARFVTVLTPTDSGHFRMDYYMGNMNPQMTAHYADDAEKLFHGPFQSFYPDGKPRDLGRFLHNRRQGVCVSYHANGIMSDSAFYNNGIVVGNKLGWHSNGMISDSLFQRNDSVQSAVYWFRNGSPSAAGLLVHGKKQGKWQYYYPDFTLSKVSFYDQGNEITVQYYDRKGGSSDKGQPDRPANFKGGPAGWKKYLEKTLYWPDKLRFTEGNSAVVAVKFTVNEEGSVIDAFVDVPFHPEFDRIALKAIRLSKGWEPAVQHNRAVEYSMRQLVTFSQPD